MNKKTTKHGVSILVFAVLISSFLLICTGVWKSTTYLVDFALQKQVYIQNRYFLEGVMRWVIRWIQIEWNMLEQMLLSNEKVTYSLKDWPKNSEHLKTYVPKVTIQRYTPDTYKLKVKLVSEQKCILKATCNLTRHQIHQKGTTEFYFSVHNWNIGT